MAQNQNHQEESESSSDQDEISETVDVDSEISSRGLRRPPRRRFNIEFKKCTYVYSGIVCLRKATPETDRCAYHQKESTDRDEKIDPKIFNTECPICLETFDVVSRSLVHKNTCGHMIHLQCMEGMDKAECPTCRGPLVNSSAELLRIIDRNAARNRRSTESENFTNLMAQLGDNDHDRDEDVALQSVGGILNINMTGMNNLLSEFSRTMNLRPDLEDASENMIRNGANATDMGRLVTALMPLARSMSSAMLERNNQ